MPSPRLGSAGLGNPPVRFQTSSFQPAFSGQCSKSCVPKPDLLRTVPTTAVIWAREAHSSCVLGLLGHKGHERDGELGLREKLHYIFHLSEEGMGSDHRMGTLAG